jgi:hypothetical protein
MPRPKPYYPLKTVKEKIDNGEVKIQMNALNSAYSDFGWDVGEIIKCLKKLNDRYHLDNPDKNHFYKTEPHHHLPGTMMDYYKSKNIHLGENVYTHLYIKNGSGEVVVSSFKNL